MKKLFILMLLMNFATLSFAQTKATNKTTPKKPKIEDVLNQQVEMLNARIDSMTVVHTNIIAANAKYIDSITIAHNNAIELVRNEQKEQYANYYNELDSDFDRFLVYISIFWGLLGVVFGIVVPILLNNKNEKNVKGEIASSKKVISKQINDQNKTIDDRFLEHKDYIDGVKNNIKGYEQRTRINSLLSEAQNVFKKHPHQAVNIYTEILNIDPKNEDALLWRGITYFILGESKQSLDDLYKLVKLHPRHARAYNNIGNVYSGEKQYKMALRNYNTALKINPQYASVYSNIAILYTEQEKYQIALEYCDKALKIDDEMIKTHKQKISIYAKLAKLSDEEETKQKYLDKIKQEQVIVQMLKDRYLSELMSS